jgi:hypothetical protein
MLAQLKPRDFTAQQMDAFVAEIKGKITEVSVFTIPDAEAFAYGLAIIDGLQNRANVKVHWYREPLTVLSVPGVGLTGVTIYESPRGTPPGGTAHEVLMQAFVNAEQFAVATTTPDVPLDKIPSPAIFVMMKPPAFMTMPGYTMPPEMKDFRYPWDPK